MSNFSSFLVDSSSSPIFGSSSSRSSSFDFMSPSMTSITLHTTSYAIPTMHTRFRGCEHTLRHPHRLAFDCSGIRMCGFLKYTASSMISDHFCVSSTLMSLSSRRFTTSYEIDNSLLGCILVRRRYHKGYGDNQRHDCALPSVPS